VRLDDAYVPNVGKKGKETLHDFGVLRIRVAERKHETQVTRKDHEEIMFVSRQLAFCFVLFCFVLFCFVLFCFVLFCFVLFCSRLQQRVRRKEIED